MYSEEAYNSPYLDQTAQTLDLMRQVGLRRREDLEKLGAISRNSADNTLDYFKELRARTDPAKLVQQQAAYENQKAQTNKLNSEEAYQNEEVEPGKSRRVKMAEEEMADKKSARERQNAILGIQQEELNLQKGEAGRKSKAERLDQGANIYRGNPDPLDAEKSLRSLGYSDSDVATIKGIVSTKPAELPDDKKRQIADLSSTVAKKKSIANQIKASIDKFDSAQTEDEKVQIGQEMLKVLNSTEGADAIGKDEAERLGGLLKFKMLNFTNPGSVFGRDLDMFSKNAHSKIDAVNQAAASDQAEIDRLYNRQGPVSQLAGPLAPQNPQSPPGGIGISQTANAATGPQEITEGTIKYINGKPYRRVKGGWQAQ
jgi:hypothetical protein